jgi:surface protein
MFNECVAFKQDISGWDTTKAGKDSQEYILEVAKRDPSTMNKFAIE